MASRLSRSLSMARRSPGVTAFALIALTTAPGCMGSAPGLEQRPDGSYKLTCRTALPRCLERAEEVCKGNRYVVTRAADHNDYIGAESTIGETQVRTSEASFVCGKRGRSYWGPDADPMAVADAHLPAAGAARDSVCVPGATQQCTGPAACRGGQACLADGAGFSRCDCGDNSPAKAAAPASPTSGSAISSPPTAEAVNSPPPPPPPPPPSPPEPIAPTRATPTPIVTPLSHSSLTTPSSSAGGGAPARH